MAQPSRNVDECTSDRDSLSLGAIANWHLQEAERYKRLELRAVALNQAYQETGGVSEYNRRVRNARSLHALHIRFARRLLEIEASQ